MSEWIDVKKEMPKEGRRVLLVVRGRVGKGYLRPLRMDSRARRYWMFDGFTSDIPTHWMPLPEPPANLQDAAEPVKHDG